MPNLSVLQRWWRRFTDSPLRYTPVPVVQLGDASDWTKQDTFVERPGIGYVVSGATAAEYGAVGIFNPAASAINVVVKHAIISVLSTLEAIRIYIGHEDLLLTAGYSVTVAQKAHRDTRLIKGFASNQSLPTAYQVYGSDAAFPNSSFSRYCGEFVLHGSYLPSRDVQLDVLLEPGMGLLAVHGTVNKDVRATWFWEESERAN